MKKARIGMLLLAFLFVVIVSVKTPVFAAEASDKQGQVISEEAEAGKTFYAKASKYTIKFNGNKATSGKMSAMKSCKTGKSYKLKANAFKRKGYTFVGWNTKANGSGKSYKNKAQVKNLTTKNGKTVTLYAQWKKTKYTITYDIKDGKNNKKNPASYYVTTSTIKLKDPSRTGYTFKGWYSDSKYKKKATAIKKGSTGNKKFYAKWSEHKYNVKFDANGGKGSMSTLKNKKYSDTYALTANKFTREGYEFVGWNTKANGSGTAYKDEESVSKLTATNGKTVTLYAQWKKKEEKPEATDVDLYIWCPQYQLDSGLLEEQQKAFEEVHPEWNITWKVALVGEDSAKTEIFYNIEAAPDVFFYANDQVSELVEAGVLAKFEGEIADMINDTIAASVVDSVKVGDDIYGIPYTHNTFFMFYDKSLLTKDDVKSLETIVEKDTADGVYNFLFDPAGGWKLGAWYYGAGLHVFGEQGDDLSAGCDWNSATGIAVTDYLIDLINHEKVVIWEEVPELVAERKLGAWFDGAWNYDMYEELLGDDLGLATIPTYKLDGKDVQLKSFYGSKAIGVNAKSDNLEAAMAFAAFIASEEQQLLRFELTGEIPTNIEAGKSDAVQEDAMASVIMDEANNCSVAQPTSPVFSARYWSYANVIAEDIYYGNLTHDNVQEFMDRFVECICEE